MPQGLAEELKSIPMSSNLGDSLERAHRFAREQAHRHVLLEHLLLSLTEDPEASLILQSANVDLHRLSTDVSAYLGSLLDDMRGDGSTEPRPDAELLRVLQAAASAAQQSKRRQIDGAIVLAAIVGDGKSPAAGLLKTHGMTFEEAIRALQRANTKARLKPLAKPAAASAPAPAPAPDVAIAPPAPAEPAPQHSASDFAVDTDASAITLAAPVEPPPAKAAAAAAPVQSADDILAAARARIQRRAAAMTGQAPAPDQGAPFFATNAEQPAAAPAPPVARPGPTGQVSEAMRELLSASGLDAAPPAVARDPHPAATPEPEARETVVPLRPKPAGPDASPPFPDAPGLAHVPRAEAAAPARPAQAAPRQAVPDPSVARVEPPPPWTGPGPAAATRPGPGADLGPGTPGSLPPQPGHAGALKAPLQVDRRQLKRAAAPLPPIQAPQQRKGAVERGPLVEAIPRRMQLDVTSEGEVRIAQERIENLVAALAGRSRPQVSEPVLMRALSVRLRVQDGRFHVEPLTPETQWLDLAPQYPSAEPLLWRWAITPRAKGKGRLVLLVSMRSVGADGSSEEVGPPDRIVEIKIRGRAGRKLVRRLLLATALVGAFMLGRIAGPLWPLLVRTVREVTGL